MITEAEIYFAQGCGRCDRFATPDCSAVRWQPALDALRDLLRAEGLRETAKWGHPCYMHLSRNIAIIGAFRAEFRLSFFDAALMEDRDGVLERQGQNTAQPDAVRFTDIGDVARKADSVRALIAQAKRHAETGTRAPKTQVELDCPPALIDALDSDPDFAEAFAALTPGRRKSYVLHVNGAKHRDTQDARITRFREKVFAGKGFNER
ncbi:YdeI family protein [Roseivivax sp. THAF30]|uniref:YdeI/OmpD-associated family protein n=1 Tax=Roseivivax sp. THAF30 TaxID=2587852 RepID=UPI001268F333|nr:YdeI/OmpD-associated family protein [Roseivivax sp. THAF30]QFT64475.1 hypothetical protein FIU91_16170 [Roseivivax sp. THAF30]